MTPTSPEEAFAGLKKPARHGFCHSCGATTTPGKRVNVRVSATAIGAQNEALGSQGRTFCPPCARKTFDAMGAIVENGHGS